MILELSEAKQKNLTIAEIYPSEKNLNKATICFKEDLKPYVRVLTDNLGLQVYVDKRTNIVYNQIVKDAGDYIYMIDTECLFRHSVCL